MVFEQHHIHTPLAEGVGTNLLERERGKIQSLRGLPRPMWSTIKQQNTIKWTNFTERRVTQRIRDMQTTHMRNSDILCVSKYVVREESFFTYFEVMVLYKNGFYF